MPSSTAISIVVLDTRRQLAVGCFPTEGAARLWGDTWLGVGAFVVLALHDAEQISDVLIAAGQLGE